MIILRFYLVNYKAVGYLSFEFIQFILKTSVYRRKNVETGTRSARDFFSFLSLNMLFDCLTGHAIFKITYLSNHDYKPLYFESDAATVNEIVLKVSFLCMLGCTLLLFQGNNRWWDNFLVFCKV